MHLGPQQFEGKQYNFALERHRLSEEELKTYGIMATLIRARLNIDTAQVQAL